MDINIILSDKHKKEENILELYSKLEYDRTKIKNIMGQNIQKQHYFIITGVIFMIMMIFSIIFIITTVLIKQQNHTQYKNNFKHDLLKSSYSKFNLYK
jgi:hypothetical protein